MPGEHKRAARIAKSGSQYGLTAEFVRDFLRDECAEVGGQQAWAEKHGVSPAYVSDVLNGRREPGDSICAGLGLRREVVYVYDHERATALEASKSKI